MERVDILCIQEHWLYNYENPSVKELIGGRNHQTKCVDDEDPISPYLRPKGIGGVMTVWSEDMDQHITQLPDGSSRVIVTQVGKDKPVFLINTYMPTSQHNNMHYVEVLDEVYEIMEKYRRKGEVVWLGDLNGSFSRSTPSANDKKLRAFCNELQINIPSATKPTYHHFIGNINSRIDHILTTSGSPIVKKVRVDERHPLNMSPMTQYSLRS